MIADDVELFARLVEVLRPWLAHLIVVGGWAHRLHRYHPLAVVPHHSALITRDADLGVPSAGSLSGNLYDALHEAGFEREFIGHDWPPVTHYRFRGEEFYAEFLAPLAGDGYKRDGSPDVAVSMAGITAQKLRHLETLFIRPWSVTLAADTGVPVSEPTTVHIANPTAFIVQKLLIHADRRGDKAAQDILYIHDTLELFGGALEPLRALWTRDINPALSDKSTRVVTSTARRLFETVTDTIRESARIPAGRELSPESLRAACEFGLREVLQP